MLEASKYASVCEVCGEAKMLVRAYGKAAEDQVMDDIRRDMVKDVKERWGN